MKRLIYFLMTMTLAFAAGCNQYEYDLPDTGLTVKESVLEFPSKGGEGYILVESSASIKAESNSNWCQVRVNGMKIDVTVASYSGIENRTALVSIDAGKGPVNVPVTQSATKFIVDDLAFDVDFVISSVKTAIYSEYNVTVSCDDEWISPEYKNDSVYITVYRNNTPEIRKGAVNVTSNGITQSIAITQAGRSLGYDDVLGDYEMSYQTSATSAVLKKNISFAKSTTAGYYSVTGLELGVLQVKFNNTDKTLEIYSGQNMGTTGDPIRTIVPFVLTTDGYISWSTTYYYKGVWNNAFDDSMTFTFADSGTYTGRVINGIYIALSTQYPVVSGSYAYAGFRYLNISLKKL